MSSPVTNPLTSTTPTPSSAASSASTAASLNSLANPNVFLQLLISQLEYQDPENPADGTEFVTQLATFSQVGQSSEMVSDLDAIKAALTTPASTTPGSTTSTANTPAAVTAPAATSTPATNS